MTMPRRLLDENTDTFLCSALRAASADRGSDQARLRALGACGVASIVTIGSAKALMGSSVAAGSGAAGTSATVLTLKNATFLALLKGAGVGLMIGLVGVTGHALCRGAVATPTALAIAPPVSAMPVKPVVDLVGNVAEPTPQRADAPSDPIVQPKLPRSEPVASGGPVPVRSSHRAFERKGATQVEAEADNATLSREVELLDDARHSLNQGHPADSVVQLDRYQRDFPKGVLGLEAAVIRIEALLASGQKGRALQQSDAFLARHPQGPHAARIRSLLAKSNL
jgi:hypothetical protein